MTNRLYLSGPMTGIPGYNHDAFNANASFLRSCGWSVFSPAEMDLELGIDLSGPLTEDQYQLLMRNDYRALTECSAIAFLPGWEKSRGAKLESDFANVLKLDRYRVDASKEYLEQELFVAFSGYARSGKNTIAEEFVKNAGFDQRGFADALKAILYALNPRIELFNDDYIGFWHVKNIVDRRGWEKAKEEPEIREFLQRLGTEGGRVALGQDVWVNTLFSQPHGARLAISDLRFENEAKAVRDRGGYVIRVERPGVGPANDHASEKLDFESDFTVQNDRTPHEAYLDVVEFLVDQGVSL